MLFNEVLDILQQSPYRRKSNKNYQESVERSRHTRSVSTIHSLFLRELISDESSRINSSTAKSDRKAEGVQTGRPVVSMWDRYGAFRSVVAAGALGFA